MTHEALQPRSHRSLLRRPRLVPHRCSAAASTQKSIARQPALLRAVCIGNNFHACECKVGAEGRSQAKGAHGCPRRRAGSPLEAPPAPADTKWRLGPVRPPGTGPSAAPSTGGARRAGTAPTPPPPGRAAEPRPPPCPGKPTGALRNTAAPWPLPPGRPPRPPRRGRSRWRLPSPQPLFCRFMPPSRRGTLSVLRLAEAVGAHRWSEERRRGTRGQCKGEQGRAENSESGSDIGHSNALCVPAQQKQGCCLAT
ncbi:formin-like protein 20 [Strigops habroptila]|uniref:formin-like protein 20 n=1 Tax=Strigops habroptila TaxID=2489341 RepID=UPI0011CEFAA9|nr:formin-like protein 20 [Strigops habroptila]